MYLLTDWVLCVLLLLHMFHSWTELLNSHSTNQRKRSQKVSKRMILIYFLIENIGKMHR